MSMGLFVTSANPPLIAARFAAPFPKGGKHEHRECWGIGGG